MKVTGTVNLGYMAGKSVSIVKTLRFLTVSVGEIKFPRSWVVNFWMRDSGLSINNDNEFCFLWAELQFHTIHPLLNTGKTLIELSKTGIKVTMIKC